MAIVTPAEAEATWGESGYARLERRVNASLLSYGVERRHVALEDSADVDRLRAACRDAGWRAELKDDWLYVSRPDRTTTDKP